ncbi:MAG TPA: hypothetical protein VIS09_03585 [Streptomyces sp.]|uniref:hypothetical protein n=1 Tax=Streptomyces sp. NBC_01358 TaxID=2903837 RepID=UPI002E36E5FE|nr:hypothetical protein [Streptomyces sp. NBC_01358]
MDALAPACTRTEAYAWLIAAVGTGHAAGTALAGVLSTGPSGAALPAAGAVACLGVLLGARHRFAAPGKPRPRGRHRRAPAHAAHR